MTLAVEIEALLFVSDQPLAMERLREVLHPAPQKEIQAALDELAASYEAPERAFRLLQVAGGWQLATKPELSAVVRRLFATRRRVRLTKAALESLAIIAYKQPTTRPEIDAIRGVASGGVIETLLERNLVKIAGRSEGIGRPLLYATTPEFLVYLGLNTLGDLPSLEELEQMLSEREAAARLADDEEMRAEEERARAGPPPGADEPAPAARLEERLRAADLPTLDELDEELRERSGRVSELSSQVAIERRRHAAEVERMPPSSDPLEGGAAGAVPPAPDSPEGCA